jgi:plastocyanin
MHARNHLHVRPVLALLLLGALGILAACGGPANSAGAADSGIHPGAGQSLAGTPGGGGGSGTAASSLPGMPMGSAAPTNAAPVAGDTVMISNFAFAPAALTTKVGTTVTWTNKDAEAHTVTSQDSGGPLTSAALDTGQSYSYTFTRPGTYRYLCTIHPFMTATVTVTS